MMLQAHPLPDVGDAAPRAATAVPAPLKTLQFDTRRLMAIPVAFAAAFGVMSAHGASSTSVLLFGGFAGVALTIAVLLTRRVGELIAAITGFSCGALFGAAIVFTPCVGGPEGLFMGSAAGFLVYRILRWSASAFPRPHPYHPESVEPAHGPHPDGRACLALQDRGTP